MHIFSGCVFFHVEKKPDLCLSSPSDVLTTHQIPTKDSVIARTLRHRCVISSTWGNGRRLRFLDFLRLSGGFRLAVISGASQDGVFSDPDEVWVARHTDRFDFIRLKTSSEHDALGPPPPEGERRYSNKKYRGSRLFCS